MSIFKHAVVSFMTMMAITPIAFSQPPDPPVAAPKPAPVVVREKNYRLQTIDVSPDGKWLAATSMIFHRQGQSKVYAPHGTQVKVWEVASGHKKWEASYEGNANNEVIFSPDSSRLLFTSSQVREGESEHPLPHVAQVVEMADGGKVIELELVLDENLREPFFSPDSRQVLALPDRTRKSPRRASEYSYDIWDAQTGKRVGPLPIVSPWEKPLGFLDGGQIFITRQPTYVEKKFAGIEIKSRSWPELKLLHSTMLENSKGGVMFLSPDGTRVAIQNFLPGGGGFEINIWNTQTGKFETPVALDTPEDWKTLLGFSSDGKTFIGGHTKYKNDAPAGLIFLSWDVQSGLLQPVPDEKLRLGRFRGSRRNTTLFSPDARSYFTGGMNDTVEHRSLSDGALIRIFELRND